MHIKKLEISGFKSFVDRTVIHFDEDVIGIVGPNGCGKSNIVDSIRWCMGEQSAKHLRGKAMSDVIFAGSESRGPHGMAEVTLTFDNSDAEAAQTLPLEYREWAEIAVSRKLHRDGTSEYLINKTQVRLKDITDLFLGTGVGTKAYSIIEQGKIGLIVSARPEDRRMLIEEAAGITKYKARRRQAETKMDATRQNLLRVGDIVSEIERNLASLKRQAAKAERYVNYKSELEDLILHDAAHRFLELTVLRQVEENACSQQTEAEQAARAELDTREAQLEVARQSTLDQEQRAELAQNEAFTADNAVRATESELTRLRDQLQNLDARRNSALVELTDLKQSLEQLSEEQATLAATLVDADEEYRVADMEHGVAADALSGLDASRTEAESVAATLRGRVAALGSQLAAAQATLEGYERRLGEMNDRKQRLENEGERLVLEEKDLEQRVTSLTHHAAELAEGKRITQEEHVRLDVEMKSLREATVTHDRVVEDAKSALSQERNRLRALEELHARLEGVGAGVKALLRSDDPALLGLVADRLSAPAELTTAFAALLGDALQFAVVHDVDRGLELLRHLSEGEKGRATIIAARPPFVAGSRPVSPTGEGVIGSLIDLVTFAPEDEGLARALVGDAVVVDDVDAASKLRRSGVGATLVTLEGTVIRADGRISGGSGDAVAEGMLEQKREIRSLSETVTVHGDEVSALMERQAALRKRTTEVGTALDRARNEAHQGELAQVTADKDLRGTEEQLAGTQKRLAALRHDLDETCESLTRAEGERQQATESLDAGKLEQTQVEITLAEAESTAEQWRQKVRAAQTIVTERRVQLAQVRERTTAVRGAAERVSRSCDEIRQRLERLDQERFECAQNAGTTAAHVMTHRAQLLDDVDAAQSAQLSSTDARKSLEEARNNLGEREAALKDLRLRVSELTEDLRRHEMTLQKLDIELEHLVGGVRERFRGLLLPTVVGDYHKRALVDDTHRARITELTQLIDRMGPVNVDAVREHAEAEERYTYYSEQTADLEKALDDLEKAISQMNRECKRLFKETYDAVNGQFRQVFPRMFRGGHAELRLTNPDDMLETGIEILAQPPGKKLANIELMSGGEKALTAVSLIFAIFQCKPSPFCILDEVDAPLDEANVTRYNEAIRSMTDHSQFILITHIKRTMQSVDVLYGVTMQEPGVSKLVGVRVADTAGRAARRSGNESAAVA